MAIAPAYAVIVEFQSDKTSYKKGDKIMFSGKTDVAHANKMVAVKVYAPDGTFVIIRESFSDADGYFEMIPIDTANVAKFAVKGIYNATAFYSQEPAYAGKSTLFDYSPDGSPVVPSAAEVMAQKNQPQTQQPTTQQPTTQQPTTQQPTTQQPTTQQPTTQQPTTQQPTTQQPQEPKCGTGTVLKDGVCVVAEPEPEPETESGYKQTHIPGFPDPNKEPQYYIDRYNNEPTYKDWFDRNFPDDTIYEIVGVAEPSEPEPPSACGPGTHLENGMCVLDATKAGVFGGGCLVATAAYGTELAPQVQQLREMRDGTIAKTGYGIAFLEAFNSVYYSFSPTIADWERENPAFREAVKITLTPMLFTMSMLNHAGIDSEYEVVGYGLGIILLNVGMYLVAPTFMAIKIREMMKSKTRRL
jgi:hypothetical protein